MIKFFSFGTILGMVAMALLFRYVPLVDQHREASIVTVQPNGGNREVFHVNLPADRIMAGGADLAAPLPAGLEWVDIPGSAGSRIELFKIRNDDNRVVGVASRLSDRGGEAFVEWTLHLPARGSIYALLDAAPTPSGYRAGTMRAGTEEFRYRAGRIMEQYAAVDGNDEGVTGRLELVTQLVGLDTGDDVGAGEADL